MPGEALEQSSIGGQEQALDLVLGSAIDGYAECVRWSKGRKAFGPIDADLIVQNWLFGQKLFSGKDGNRQTRH